MFKMEKKKLIPAVYIINGAPYQDRKGQAPWKDPEACACYYNNSGADALCLLEFSTEDREHEKNLACMKTLIRSLEIPACAGGLVKRFEDVKKYLYTGAGKAVFLLGLEDKEALSEACSRFGRDKLIVGGSLKELEKQPKTLKELACSCMALDGTISELLDFSRNWILPVIGFVSSNQNADGLCLLKEKNIAAISGELLAGQKDFMELKEQGKQEGIFMSFFESAFNWSSLTLNSDGLIPVIVQDYRTQAVLMLAYMNEEAFYETLRSGKMTYYSRSRKELWKKGLTSGHFQYVKELLADCDSDTILARVSQVGTACHTGSTSCFFKEIARKDYKESNPLAVLEKEYATILDRKMHPREGSYTNYLLEKGIDKILKKVGEEATEIVIAAKNPDAEEIKYEISDFLYHVMVLMVEKGITWEDITKELSNR